MAALDAGFRLRMLHPLGTAHRGPVIFVFRGAEQAHLVVVAIGSAARPGEFVGAAPKHKHIHEFLRHEFTSGSVQPRTQRHHRPNLGVWVGYYRASGHPHNALSAFGPIAWSVEDAENGKSATPFFCPPEDTSFESSGSCSVS